MNSKLCICFHGFVEDMDALISDGENCVFKIHTERQIFYFIMVCYYLTLIKYGTLDKSWVSGQP
jgi:hypothetical protein